MSQHHLRHDKTCLNCGATVEERFCTRCGQENLEPKESVGHLINHFFSDLTHFDGKFFVTVKDLIIRPGFLTREYVAGRRMSYLNPIRMYIFISAVFFLTLFTGKEEPAAVSHEDNVHSVNLFRQDLADSLRSAGTGAMGKDATGKSRMGKDATGRDATRRDSMRRSFNNEMAIRLDSTEKVKSHDEYVGLSMSNSWQVVIDMTENKYSSLHEYDSIQRGLPDSARDKGMMHWLLRNNVRQKEKHGGRSKIHIQADVHHELAKIMFVLLPLFALYVGWFYSKKKYYYVNHAIFSVHYHCFIFLLFLVMLLLGKVLPGDWTPIILSLLSIVLAFVYLVAALHGMYRQSFWWSLLKGLAISLLYIITLVVANSLLLIITFLTI